MKDITANDDGVLMIMNYDTNGYSTVSSTNIWKWNVLDKDS